MEKKALPWPFRVILFLLLACLAVNAVSVPLIYPYESKAYEWTQGLYDERPGALDAIFIGSSNTYAFWVPLFAWQEYGIATYNYTVSSQKMEGFRYFIEEARKTQPDALYVVTLSNPSLNITVEHTHLATDYMHHSITRLGLIRAYTKYNSFIPIKAAELIFPLLRYHFRWDELSDEDYSRSVFAKGATVYQAFLNKSKNISGSIRSITAREKLEAQEEEVICDLLDYLEKNQVRVLFLNPPQYGLDDERRTRLNTLLDLVETRGYPVLRTREKLDEIGFDFSQDYYNEGHTNIHGAEKYTSFVARYLLEHYGFADKRGDSDYADFDKAFKQYMEVISPYIFDVELNGTVRTKELSAPEPLSAESEGDTIVFSWGASTGADGYLVYRKSETGSESGTVKTPWEIMTVSDKAQMRFVDTSTVPGSVYYYTAIPYRYDRENGEEEMQIGNFIYSGISVGAQILSQEVETQESSMDDMT